MLIHDFLLVCTLNEPRKMNHLKRDDNPFIYRIIYRLVPPLLCLHYML